MNSPTTPEPQNPELKNSELTETSNFIKTIITDDLASNKVKGIITRFPPEPNGYLHIGHAKSICINFGLAKTFEGRCHLRFDDTNPSKEDVEYEESIKEDVRWLGFDWGDYLFYASDYYQQLYDYAVQLIKMDKAYVCDLNADEIRAHRGTLTKPGVDSPFRNRTSEENLDLFERMKTGEFDEGTRILRAKIDMASPNINLRDPAIYRILKQPHNRTGDGWRIYPMYDFAHGLSDMIEGITHSICTLEFEDHRPLYDWFLDTLKTPCHPQQIEFARLNLTNTVMSKRHLLELVSNKSVSGWDDPRLPTLAGLRRRGVSAKAIRNFCDGIGVAKGNSTVDIGLLNHYIREDLNITAPRVMAVLHPLKLVITNYPDGQTEEITTENNPEDPSSGTRQLTFSKEIYIEQDDFMEEPPKKYFRLAPGQEVRLKHAYYVTCAEVIKNEKGEVIEVHCTYDPATKGGWSDDGRKVRGTLHWVSVPHALNAEVRLYDHLFLDSEDCEPTLNPDSLTTLSNCKVEPGLAKANPGDRFQFMRQGYFCVDPDSSAEKLVFNRTVSLKDSWAKEVTSINR